MQTPRVSQAIWSTSISLPILWCRSQYIMRLKDRDLFIDSTSRCYIYTYIPPVFSKKLCDSWTMSPTTIRHTSFMSLKYNSPKHTCVSHMPWSVVYTSSILIWSCGLIARRADPANKPSISIVLYPSQTCTYIINILVESISINFSTVFSTNVLGNSSTNSTS